MKIQKHTVVAVAVLSGSIALAGCASYNGVKGTVVEREHEICGVELSMDAVAYDIQNTKGGTIGSKGGGSTSGGSKPKTETKPKVDTTKPEPAPGTTVSPGTAGGTIAGVGAGAAVVPLLVDKPTPTPTKTSKSKKSKGCKEKYEVEVKDSKGDIHEVKVDRQVWERCVENKSFPKCAG